ncbi:MAG: restriction endonuclease subunit S [bacterium]|nr:restriction endonuclease subunit S [bacterium]
MQLDTGFAAGGDDQAFDSITGIPHIRPLNLTSDEELTIEDTKYIPIDRPKPIDYIQKGEVLFNNTNSSIWVGKSVVFNEDYLACCSNHMTRLTINLEKAVPQYIADIFNLLRRKRLFEFYCVNFNNQAGVNTEMLGDLLIPLPPPDIQRALVADLDQARATRKSKLVEADELLKGMDEVVMRELGLQPSAKSEPPLAFAVRLADALRRFDAHYHEPEYVRFQNSLKSLPFSLESLSQLSDNTIFSGTTPLSGGDDYTDEINGIPFVQSGDIENLEDDYRPTTFLQYDVHYKKMKTSQLQRNDLLIAIVGATIGKIGVYRSDKPANINQAIAGIRLNKDRINVDYVEAIMKSTVGQKQLDRIKRPVARANINLEEIGSLMIPIPPLDIQERIIAELHRRRDLARQLRQEANSLWREAQARFEQALIG